MSENNENEQIENSFMLDEIKIIQTAEFLEYYRNQMDFSIEKFAYDFFELTPSTYRSYREQNKFKYANIKKFIEKHYEGIDDIKKILMLYKMKQTNEAENGDSNL